MLKVKHRNGLHLGKLQPFPKYIQLEEYFQTKNALTYFVKVQKYITSLECPEKVQNALAYFVQYTSILTG